MTGTIILDAYAKLKLQLPVLKFCPITKRLDVLGQDLWHSGLSRPHTRWHPTWVPVQAQAVLLLIQFRANAPRTSSGRRPRCLGLCTHTGEQAQLLVPGFRLAQNHHTLGQ